MVVAALAEAEQERQGLEGAEIESDIGEDRAAIDAADDHEIAAAFLSQAPNSLPISPHLIQVCGKRSMSSLASPRIATMCSGSPRAAAESATTQGSWPRPAMMPSGPSIFRLAHGPLPRCQRLGVATLFGTQKERSESLLMKSMICLASGFFENMRSTSSSRSFSVPSLENSMR